MAVRWAYATGLTGVGMRSITEIAFFKGVADINIAAFERRCLWKRFDEGQVIVDFDDQTNAVYFLLTGDVRILLRTPGGKEFILADMRAGEIFGELSAVDGKLRSANVTALTRALVCLIEGPVFREMLAHSPMLSNRLMQLLTRRIRDLNARMLEHAVLDIRHNLYAELLRLSMPAQGTTRSTLSLLRRTIMCLPPHRLPERAGHAGVACYGTGWSPGESSRRAYPEAP